MDELLKGKTILIGREPGKPCLLVAVSINGVYKAAEMADCLPVPDSVSRCKVAEGSAHCKLEIDVAGSVRLINMKAANLTYVNGVAVESKKVSESDNIALGREKYAVSLKKVLDTAARIIKVVAPPPPPVYPVYSLEKVWNWYHDAQLDIRKRQRKIGLMRSMPMMFTLGSGAIGGLASYFFQEVSWLPVLTGCLFGIGVILMVYGFYLGSTDKSIEELDELADKFQERYVCPNPQCRHFMGNVPYKVLRQSKKCPYCGCLFNEK